MEGRDLRARRRRSSALQYGGKLAASPTETWESRDGSESHPYLKVTALALVCMTSFKASPKLRVPGSISREV
jgi:hypothetical protein